MGRSWSIKDLGRHVARHGGEMIVEGMRVRFLDPAGKVVQMAHKPHGGIDGRWTECQLKAMRRNGWNITEGLAA